MLFSAFYLARKNADKHGFSIMNNSVFSVFPCQIWHFASCSHNSPVYVYFFKWAHNSSFGSRVFNLLFPFFRCLWRYTDPTPAPPLQGRGVPTDFHLQREAEAAPLPCRGGAGVGLVSLFYVCQGTSNWTPYFEISFEMVDDHLIFLVTIPIHDESNESSE